MISTRLELQTQAAVTFGASGVFGAQLRLLLYNKQNKTVVKLNDNTFVEEMRTQALEEIAYRINAYFIKNNITTTKFYAARTLLSGDVATQTTSIEEAKKLREKDSQTKILGRKAKLTQR